MAHATLMLFNSPASHRVEDRTALWVLKGQVACVQPPLLACTTSFQLLLSQVEKKQQQRHSIASLPRRCELESRAEADGLTPRSSCALHCLPDRWDWMQARSGQVQAQQARRIPPPPAALPNVLLFGRRQRIRCFRATKEGFIE